MRSAQAAVLLGSPPLLPLPLPLLMLIWGQKMLDPSAVWRWRNHRKCQRLGLITIQDCLIFLHHNCICACQENISGHSKLIPVQVYYQYRWIYGGVNLGGINEARNGFPLYSGLHHPSEKSQITYLQVSFFLVFQSSFVNSFLDS